MYFRTRQYPCLSGLPKKKQKRIVMEAIEANCPLATWRFTFFAISVVALPAISDRVFGSTESFDWIGLWVALVSGVLFYIYLLWEINRSDIQRRTSLRFTRKHSRRNWRHRIALKLLKSPRRKARSSSKGSSITPATIAGGSLRCPTSFARGPVPQPRFWLPITVGWLFSSVSRSRTSHSTIFTRENH